MATDLVPIVPARNAGKAFSGPAFRSRSRCRTNGLAGLLFAASFLGACSGETGSEAAGNVLALDAPTLAAEIAAGRLSAESVTQASIDRIAAIDDAGPELNAVIEINPDALMIARELDRRFDASGPVGPLHGLPILLKANIDTSDAMATSAGSIALADHRATADAPFVGRLRAAGAVILGKANLSEWANFRSTSSISGWSSLGGQTRNPYALDRNPCGSSSGSAAAVAARLVPLAVGTETDGSIVCPAAANGVVGVMPTIGRVEQTGIIPIAASQDTAGPIARTVAGAALLLSVMLQIPEPGLVEASAAAPVDLAGFRLGIVRDYTGAGELPPVEAAFAAALETLAATGAALIDPVTLALDPGVRDAEFEVLLFEFRDGINTYLENVRNGPGSLAELIAYNDENSERVMPLFGQDILVAAEARGGLDDPAYTEALASSRDAVRTRLEVIFRELALDALIAPANGPAWTTNPDDDDRFAVSSSGIAAISGYPNIVVPSATIDGLPIAIAFIGPPGTEADLIRIAGTFEALRGEFPPPPDSVFPQAAGTIRRDTVSAEHVENELAPGFVR